MNLVVKFFNFSVMPLPTEMWKEPIPFKEKSSIIDFTNSLWRCPRCGFIASRDIKGARKMIANHLRSCVLKGK